KYAQSIVLRSGARLTFLMAHRKVRATGTAPYLWHNTQDTDTLLDAFKRGQIPRSLQSTLEAPVLANVDFDVCLYSGSLMPSVVAETFRQTYDLILSGAPKGSLLRRLFNPISLTQLINEAKAPVFLVPAASRFNEIQHITYAVDLTAYDPFVIQQVKEIAGLFDAKLTVAHVNAEATAAQRETYLNSLERTISDTLDYPKVYYKFFDHADPFRGIKKFVDHSNSQMLAMINRSPLSWRELFSAKSMTMRMTQQSRVPILAFRKKDV
ncbi:MAG: universal stress protein, partial [Bacteroidota bacterium]